MLGISFVGGEHMESFILNCASRNFNFRDMLCVIVPNLSNLFLMQTYLRIFVYLMYSIVACPLCLV